MSEMLVAAGGWWSDQFYSSFFWWTVPTVYEQTRILLNMKVSAGVT